MNRPTYVFSQTLTHTLYMWEYTLNRHIYALTLTHLHSLMSILQFPQMERHTWSNSGTSPYMQFPPVPAPFPLKTLPLYSLWTKKNTLSFCTYTHTENGGLPATEKQQRNCRCTVVYQDLTFSTCVRRVGSGGNQRGGRQGSPLLCGGLTQPPPCLTPLQLPENTGNSHCVPMFCGFGG